MHVFGSMAAHLVVLGLASSGLVPSGMSSSSLKAFSLVTSCLVASGLVAFTFGVPVGCIKVNLKSNDKFFEDENQQHHSIGILI